MTDRLSLYVSRPSPLHRLNPITTLVLALVLPLAALGRVLPELLRGVVPVVLPFAVSVFLIQGFLWPHGTPLVSLGPFALKREGLAFAIAAVGRILMVVSSFVLFALITRPDTLMIGLAQRGLPTSLVYLLVSTIQIVPRFRARASAILDAQRARGLETSGRLRQRARAVLPLVVPLILSSLVDVEERALAIEARAFNYPGPKTSLVEVGEAGWEPAARWTLLLGALACLGLRLWLR